MRNKTKMADIPHRLCPCDFPRQRQYVDCSHTPHQMATRNNDKTVGELFNWCFPDLHSKPPQKNKQWWRTSLKSRSSDSGRAAGPLGLISVQLPMLPFPLPSCVGDGSCHCHFSNHSPVILSAQLGWTRLSFTPVTWALVTSHGLGVAHAGLFPTAASMLVLLVQHYCWFPFLPLSFLHYVLQLHSRENGRRWCLGTAPQRLMPIPSCYRERRQNTALLVGRLTFPPRTTSLHDAVHGIE